LSGIRISWTSGVTLQDWQSLDCSSTLPAGVRAFDLPRFGRDLYFETKQVSGCPLKFFPVASQKRKLRTIAGKFAGHRQAKTSW
jgi:hypothetical protein